jgi:hypothetical protein
MTKPPAPPYDPTPEETAVLRRLAEHRARSPEMTLGRDDGATTLRISHKDKAVGRALLLDALGAREAGFLDPFLHQVINAASPGATPDNAAATFMLAAIKDLEPRDTTEAMLAAQMAAVHMATMKMARQLAAAEMIPQQDAAERAFNKLARTYAAQMDTLKRYRSKGEQKVTVQHVTVNDGGQAVVGDVRSGGRGDEKA